MFNASFLKNMTVNDLRLLDAETLVSPQLIARLSEMVEDSEFESEAGAAQEFRENLSYLLNQNKTEVQKNPDAHRQLTDILNKLAWKALPSLGQKYRKQILNEGVLPALRKGVDIKKYLQKQLDPHEFGTWRDKQQRQDLAYVLESNQEQLGNQMISIEGGGKVRPTLQSWLKSYNSSQPLTDERGKFNQINYLNQNQNPRLLSAEDKEILSVILELYDWLLFPPPASDVISATIKEPGSAESTESAASPYIQAEKFVMPPEVAGTEEGTVKVPPVVPQRKAQEGFLREKEPAAAAKPEIRQEPAKEPAVPASSMAERLPSYPVHLAKPLEKQTFSRVNIQDILNKKEAIEDHQAGVKMGDGHGKVSASDLSSIKENQKSAEIDKKLEELKKRARN